MLQVLHGHTACTHVVHFGRWTFTDSAYCPARKRLPLRVDHRLLEQLADAARKATAASSRWVGHRVWVVDGSSVSMPDEPERQAHFGRPGNRRAGCGFPVAKWLALFDVATGMLLRSSTTPLRSHEMGRCAGISHGPGPGDVVLGDRGFRSYAHPALLVQRSPHGVFRVHQGQIVDFRPGRPQARRGPSKDSAAPPYSRRVLAQGDSDQIVVWSKPKLKPVWMTAEAYAALPEGITVRELRYRVETPGSRVGEVTIVATLLDAKVVPAEALADLSFRRWGVEVNSKHLRTTMAMDVLRRETVAGVRKGLAMFAPVSDLGRSVMVASGRVQGVAPGRISVIATIRWSIGTEGGDVSVLVVNPSRPGRVEPRVKKRRPKRYYFMTKPRSELRELLPMKGF